jgi:hypothetical protein
MISKQTAMDLALAHREVETAEALLADVEAATANSTFDHKDIRDAFGRKQNGLQLGVPSGHSGHRLFDVPWQLAKPIIRAHIQAQKAQIEALTELALLEAREAAGADAAEDMQ